MIKDDRQGNISSFKCKYSTGITISCLIGLLLSTYAVTVEIHAEADKDYRAMCDISERISCTKVFSSRYGKGFGLLGSVFGETSFLNLPNGFYGIAFYFLIPVFGFINNQTAAKAQLTLCAISNVLSLYLAYLLYFVLEDFCVVCVSTYAVNFTNIILAYKHYQTLNKDISTETAAKNYERAGEWKKNN